MNEVKLLNFILLGVLVLSGCVNMGTKEKPLEESLAIRADGTYVGVTSLRPSIDSSVSVVTLYNKDDAGNFTAISTSEPNFTPTVAGQTLTGGVTAAAGSIPIGLGLGLGQAATANAIKAAARTNAGVAREGIEASKEFAPSTVFNIVPIADSSPTSISGATSNAVNDIGVGFNPAAISDWAR